MELLQRTAKLPSKLSKSTPAGLVTIMTAPSMRSFGRRMREAAKKEWTMKCGQDVTRTFKNSNGSKAWIPSANVLPLQEPGRQLLEAMATQQRLSILRFMLGAVVRSVSLSPQQLRLSHLPVTANISKFIELCNPSNPKQQVAVLLLQWHNIQLQHRGPHQPLFIVEVRPGQGFMRQAPQAFHEGSITFIQTWTQVSRRPHTRA